METFNPETKLTGLRDQDAKHAVDESKCSAVTGPLASTPYRVLTSRDGGYLSAGVQAARTGRELRRTPVVELPQEERAVEHQALQKSRPTYSSSSGALLVSDDEDTEDDFDGEDEDDNLSIASEHMDVDDHIAAENMERFCIRVSNIVETFSSN
ncbi:hypothetical protein IFM61392_07795 [Aspergillus lentulus]|uniref:Uncharacterized protein n=1 Tax=Aspergillus lentulus TaxID=293939 RepID=A0ABQ1ADY1_ASPLE|nr:hypothetical protein IFM60648_05546 [Aspergillus lentulus]GFG13177.1 hypothetical protein IFM61392_07795 [Aspergillus lentulus]